MIQPRVLKVIDAVTATTVSDAIYVGGAKRIGLMFRRADNAGGASAFTVGFSMEPADTTTPTFSAFNMLISNVTNDNTHHETRVNGATITNTNADAFLFVDENCVVNWLQITVTETSDGTHSAWIILEY